MNQVKQRQVESRLRQIRDELARQEREAGGVDPLEALWRQAARSQLSEIDAALERLPDHRYGDCEQCGEAISADRLNAVPWARKCFRCQTARPEEKVALLRYGVVVPLDWD